MKKNIRFLTLRNVESWLSYQIVYEWEDEMCKQLICKMQNAYAHKKCYKLTSFQGFMFFLYNRFFKTNTKTLFIYFEMSPRFGITIKTILKKFKGQAKINPNIHNKKNSIPIIIDFFLKKEYLDDFYGAYNKVPFLFITSAEAYSFLKANNCPLKIYHLPLSIPDKYKLDENVRYEKKYNLVLMGRNNPFLLNCLNKYCKNHPHFTYLYQQNIDGELYCVTNKGDVIGQFNTRESYMDLIRSTKVAFYSTPGIDSIDDRANGFNQVTPKLFELMTAQCLILARYPDNEETRYFELNKIIPNIKDYEEFEMMLEYYLESASCPILEYRNYLSKHYTSQRCIQLMDVIKKYE